MKILSSQQIRSADEYTIANEPISSVDLMERASKAFVTELLRIKNDNSGYVVFTGPGNNGGDGLVIARLLSDQGFEVQVIHVLFTDRVSEDFAKNKARIGKTTVPFTEVRSVKDIPEIAEKSTIIDAIFGSGLSRPVEGFPGEVINYINSLNHFTVAVDIPSGLFHDSNAANKFQAVIKADLTISFQVAKLCFMLPELSQYVGRWVIVDIGLDKNFISGLESNYHITQQNDITISQRDPFSHKGTYGHALLCAGSLGKIGAAILSSRACLRSGVGLLSTLIPACGYSIIQESVPEAMAIPTDSEEEISGAIPSLEKFNAVGIGPGIGTSEPTKDFLTSLIRSSTCRMVLDADALNIIGKDRSLLDHLNNRAVLTPHSKEFDRLAGDSSTTFERIQKQIEMSKEFGIVVLLKGHYTSISTPEGQVYFNTTGNPGMSTAGSGDVLTGIILALLAMGYTSLDAARIGAYLHGLSGDCALKSIGDTSMIASDLIDHLPEAIKQLQH